MSIMKRHWKLVAGIVLLIALALGVARVFLRSSSGQGKAVDPILGLVFEDGAKMEVLAIDIGILAYQEFPAVMPGWGEKSSSHSSYAHGFFHGGGFTTTTREENAVKSWTAAQDYARPLLIGIRLREASGKPMNIASSFSRLWMHEDMRLSKRGGRIRGGDWAGFTGDELAADLRKLGIDMHIQLHDPDSGWLPMSGPLWIGEEHPGDHVIALSVWRRDLQTLRFRVIREAGEIVEFQLPAPPTPAWDMRVIAAEPLPIIRTGDGYTARLEKFEISDHIGGSPSIRALPVLESARYTTDGERDAHLEGRMIGLRDEAGNLDPFHFYHKRAHRGLFQRQSSRLELLYQVRRNDSYPMPAADCLIIAEGLVSADGGEVVFTPLPGAARMGISEIPAMAIGPSEDGFYSKIVGEHLLPIRVEGKFDGAGLPGRFHGHEPGDLRLVVFREDEDESSGISNFQGSGSSSGSMDVHIGKVGGSRRDWEFHREDEWYAPSGALAPGKRIRLALAPPLWDDLHIFPIEVPADAFRE